MAGSAARQDAGYSPPFHQHQGAGADKELWGRVE